MLYTNPPVGIWVGLCDEPNDINPSEFKRELYLRKDYSKMGAYYFTPTWKKLRSFLVLGFIFTSSAIMEDNISSTALFANSNMKVKIVIH
uniref:MBD domain-containing protein n=1 Tax=Solanum lycopersicum TaxID=4081 RepID=A0A3Q7IVZ5_SOLLC